MGLQLNKSFKPQFDRTEKTVNGYERIYIDHENGTFRSSKGPQSQFMNDAAIRMNEKWPTELRLVGLGLIRQRQMWPKRDFNSGADGHKIADKGKQCISLDGEWGNPQSNFPGKEWESLSGNTFDISANARGDHRLECSLCPFTRWSRDGKTSAPCQPHWYIPVIPILHDKPVFDQPPAILDMTQSGITVFKEFFKNEIGTKNFLFHTGFHVSVKRVMKNNRTFSKPNFGIVPIWKQDVNNYPFYTYWIRRITAEMHDPANLAGMGGKPVNKFTSLKPTGA